MDLDDWKTNAALGVAGALIGGPIGIVTSVALMYAKHLAKKKAPTLTVHPSANHAVLPTMVPDPPALPRAVHLAASGFMKTKPKIGTTKTVLVEGKQYLLTAEHHPAATKGEHGGVSITPKG